VGELAERVGLVHKLRELAGAKELADGGHHGTDVDEIDRSDVFGLADAHALTDDAFHATEADTQFLLDELTHGLDATVAQVVDVVRILQAVVEADEVIDQGDEVSLGDDAHGERHVQAEALVELVAADALQVVAPGVKDLGDEEFLGVAHGERIARAHALVELESGFLGDGGRAPGLGTGAPDGLLLDGRENVGMIGMGVRAGKELDQLFIGAAVEHRKEAGSPRVGSRADVASVGMRFGAKEGEGGSIAKVALKVFWGKGSQGAQKDGDGNGPLAIELDGDIVALSGLKLHPGATIGDEFSLAQQAPCGPILFGVKVDAGRADQLADDNALGAVDDKGAVLGHEGKVAKENLAHDGLVLLAVVEEGLDVEGSGIGHVALDALGLAVLGIFKPEAQVEFLTELCIADAREVELQVLVEALDGRDLVKELTQSVFDDPSEGFELDLDQARQLLDVGNLSVGFETHALLPSKDNNYTGRGRPVFRLPQLETQKNPIRASFHAANWVSPLSKLRPHIILPSARLVNPYFSDVISRSHSPETACF
jgi:hypothetical protein